MIEVEFFTYTDEQWDAIKGVVRQAWPRCRPDRVSIRVPRGSSAVLLHQRDGVAAGLHRDSGA